MTNSDACDHPELSLGRHVGNRVDGDRGLPRQVQFHAMCLACKERVTVDYNIAFIDGEKQ